MAGPTAEGSTARDGGAHEGGVDTRDMLVVHLALRREFRLAPGLVRRTRDGDTRRARTVATHLTLMADLLRHHHGGEDRLLWPALLARVPRELAPVVALMESHHETIHEVMEAVVALLPRWREAAGTADRDALAGYLDRLSAVLDEHLTAEEQRLLPLAARFLTEAEWARLGEEGVGGLPKRRLPLVFGMLMYQGDPAVISTMLAGAPPLPRLLMSRFGPRAYARYARRVHGTPAP
ncbi:MAG: hemerythrin domain-containing protein [Pseudonocardia sp.]|nr:hemerythrin domain-containing protein [Pseudonocardia sp.]